MQAKSLPEFPTALIVSRYFAAKLDGDEVGTARYKSELQRRGEWQPSMESHHGS